MPKFFIKYLSVSFSVWNQFNFKILLFKVEFLLICRMVILEQWFVAEQPLLLELRFDTKPISKQIALRNQNRSQIHSSNRSSLRDPLELICQYLLECMKSSRLLTSCIIASALYEAQCFDVWNIRHSFTYKLGTIKYSYLI